MKKQHIWLAVCTNNLLHKQAMNQTLLSKKISRLRLRLPNHRQINSKTQHAINEEAIVSLECRPWNRKEITMSN
jgi:hypothetical protein